MPTSPIIPTHIRKRSISLDDEKPKQGGTITLFDSVGSPSLSTDNNNNKNWSEKRSVDDLRRKRRFIVLGLLSFGGFIGWNIKPFLKPDLPDYLKPSQKELSKTFNPKISCDPYSYKGYLLTNATDPILNSFQPISAPAHCQPIDYFSPIGSKPNANVDFARDKVIVTFGDSIDRNHVLHACKSFFKGELEMIGEGHELNPPYPFDPNPSIIPPGIAWDDENGVRHWPSWELAQPWICTVPRLNLRLVSVFHYGFVENDDHIVDDHYYPPARLEDRFDSILVPILQKMSELYGTNPEPDIISITPAFWGIMRRVVDDDAKAMKMLKEGHSQAEIDSLHLEAWTQMTKGEHNYLLGKFRGFINQVADAWPNAKHAPLIVWRGLHHIRETRKVPFNRVQQVDQIARSVVEDLIEESKTLLRNKSNWFSSSKEDSKILSRGLEKNLIIDEWASFLLGYENAHLTDHIHPFEFPGSWLYMQMMMSKLEILTQKRALGIQ